MSRTRRAVLARGSAFATGSALASGLALTGCLGRRDSDVVSVLAAGSLQHALETRFREEVDTELRVETRGSAACARMVEEGLRDPDLLALADPVLFSGLTAEYTEFATNALCVAYNPDSAAGERVASASVPLDPLLDGEARIGRTDPDADPLGYRTLFALRAAKDRWGRPYPSLLDPGQLFPETELLTVLETGELDAAFAYRNMAADHDVPFRTLPPAVDFSSPQYADGYGRYSYELPSGRVVRGTPITYGAAVRRAKSSRVRSVFETLVGGEWLGSAFEIPSSFPRVREVSK
jgi:molybdate/tungstate transport system substrate-binding protein